MKFHHNSLPKSATQGFSLLEVLVAMAVLSLMMVFLFNLVAQTIRAWESGSRQVEAAQAARIGLETIAQDLQFALGEVALTPPLQTGGSIKTNIVPFFSTNNARQAAGIPINLPLAPSSGQMFVVAPSSADGNRLYEFGFVSVFVTSAQRGEGYGTMRGRRYYLLRHSVSATNNSATGRGDFYYANAAPDTNWITERSEAVSQVGQASRNPLIPNCYQLRFLYASNAAGVLSFTNRWTNTSKLPSGVMISAKVMDEKTAARIANLPEVRSNGLSETSLTDPTISRILNEGTIEVHRFVPFVNAK